MFPVTPVLVFNSCPGDRVTIPKSTEGWRSGALWGLGRHSAGSCNPVLNASWWSPQGKVRFFVIHMDMKV